MKCADRGLKWFVQYVSLIKLFGLLFLGCSCHRLAIGTQFGRNQLARLFQFVHFLNRILVVCVTEVTRGDDDVLIAVQVHVQEDGLPRPVGRSHAGIGGNFFKGAVAAVVKEHVAGNLRPIINDSNRGTWKPG
ncbi:MAG: hypothetical protein ABSC18_18550, partial [Verrucomicrobiota bacterium]